MSARSKTVFPHECLDFLPLAAQIPILPETQEFRLEEANQALVLLNQGKIQGAAVLRVTPLELSAS